MVTMLGTVIPPLVVLSVISLFYDAFRSNLIVSRVMKGMQAGVAAVIFDVVLTMAGQIIGRKRAIPNCDAGRARLSPPGFSMCISF